MNFLELTKRRYSLRKYSNKPVPREAMDRCLEAARLAPSACNSQPWRFLVLDDQAVRAQVAATFSGLYAMNTFAKKAPVLVAVITERSKYSARLGGSFRGTQYALVDIGIAGEHFCLQAAEEGLGTCWLGFFNEKAVKRILGLPHRTKLDIMISVGYPEDNAPVREKKRRSLDDIRQYIASDPA